MKKTIYYILILAGIGFIACNKNDTSTNQPTHPYGLGNGQIMIYALQDCHHGSTTIYIDGQYCGVIGNYFPSGTPDCNNSQAFTKVLTTGTHHFHGVNSAGSYDSDFNIIQDQCTPYNLDC
ncbi:MAG: hypothetical protein JSS78_07445 [Bacteroidetes bacterium]|nr:hypothetical protein [Bacteroidota bacterium]